MFTVRPYLETDVETVLTVWWESWHSIEEGLRHPQAFSDWRSRWVQEIAESQVIAVVEDHDGAVVAFAAANLQSNELTQLFVRPDQKRRGIGKLLIGWARTQMPHGFRLSTLKKNQSSRSFYLHQGFVEGETRVSPVNGMEILDYRWTPTGERAFAELHPLSLGSGAGDL